MSARRKKKKSGCLLIILVVIFLSILAPSDDKHENNNEISSSNRTSNVQLETTVNSETITVSNRSQLPTAKPTVKVTTPPKGSTFKATFLDVGQADAAIIECDGRYMLIDGGGKESSSLIYSYLRQRSINHLDIIIASHAHEDHVGGLAGALNYAKADIVLSPVKSYDSNEFSDFLKYANQNSNSIKIPSIGDTYKLGSSTVSILGLNAGSETNDSSIIVKVNYGKTSFLFTGDAERDAEQKVLNSGADLSATVLKVGHHGSDTSTTYPFLREVMPKYAVISVGANNSYEHPTDNTLSRLRDAGANIYRTDLHGDIIFTSDGNTVSVSTEKTATKDEVLTAGGKKETPKPTTKPADNQKTGTDYVGNKNSKVFHYSYCSSVKKMKESNKYFFTGTRDQMIAKGYKPCGNCHP